MTLLVTGAGGFIGGHLVNRLVEDGHEVIALDRKRLREWWQHRDDVMNIDLCDLNYGVPPVQRLRDVTGVFHLAADMGGIGYIESHHLGCAMSTSIDLRLIDWMLAHDNIERVLYTSSACVYPAHRQGTTDDAPLKESDAYPAMAEDGYGWQKLYTERLMRHLTEFAAIDTRVARLHNAYGPHGTWRDGREKAPAAICRKVAKALLTGNHHIEVWGDGEQTRSFMHVNDCVEGLVRLFQSDVAAPTNIGSAERVTINELVHMVADIAEIEVTIEHIDGPLGVRGRSSDNTFVRQQLGWEPKIPLRTGLVDTFQWVYKQVVESDPVIERIEIPSLRLPCGHICDRPGSHGATVECETCGRMWRLTMEPGGHSWKASQT